MYLSGTKHAGQGHNDGWRSFLREKIRFLLGDTLQELGGFDPGLTALDWLRGPARLPGTKEGCNEGDCGACTVVVVRPENGRLHYRAVNACIVLMGTLDGCQLLTVEHLKHNGTLHPVQQAMVDCHGSQCGFCTPGFVMSLFALAKNHPVLPDAATLDKVLAGNLCRCTGYAPIIRAAQKLYEAPLADGFDASAATTLARLEALKDEATLCITGDAGRFFAPTSQDALAKLLTEHPQATLLAGGTDVGLWITKGMRKLDPVIYLGRIESLQRITETANRIAIDAGVTCAAAEAVLARYYPDFGELLNRYGSVQIRNSATLGGNIANGSPIGDASPALIALGAQLHLRHGDHRRAIALEDFFIAYGRQDRATGEFVTRISLPKPEAGQIFRAYKISKRFDQDISAVLGAFCLTLSGGKVEEIRIAFGGMAATPKRALLTENALRGTAFDEAALEQARAALAHDFAPISDMRASAAYRLAVAQNLLTRLWHEVSQGDVPVRLRGTGSLAHV